MKIEPMLLERIPNIERDKLNISVCLLEIPPKSSGKYILYNRGNAPSSFYNSKNIRTCTFYKNTSLFFSRIMFNKIFKENESK